MKTWKKNIKPLLGKYCTLRLCKGFPVSLRRCLSSVEPQILGRRISVHACIVYACSLARFLCLFVCLFLGFFEKKKRKCRSCRSPEVWWGLTLCWCHQQGALGLNLWLHSNWARKAFFFFFFFFSFFVRLTFDVIRNAWCMIKLMANQYDKSDAMSMNWKTWTGGDPLMWHVDGIVISAWIHLRKISCVLVWGELLRSDQPNFTFKMGKGKKPSSQKSCL